MSKPRFCNEACRDGWQTDRRYGAIYAAFPVDSMIRAGWAAELDAAGVNPASKHISHAKATAIMGECCYCRADLVESESQ